MKKDDKYKINVTLTEDGFTVHVTALELRDSIRRDVAAGYWPESELLDELRRLVSEALLGEEQWQGMGTPRLDRVAYLLASTFGFDVEFFDTAEQLLEWWMEAPPNIAIGTDEWRAVAKQSFEAAMREDWAELREIAREAIARAWPTAEPSKSLGP